MENRIDDGLLSWFAATALVEGTNKIEIDACRLKELVLDLQEARAELKNVPVLVSDKPMFMYNKVVLQHSDNEKKLFVFDCKTGEYIETIKSTR